MVGEICSGCLGHLREGGRTVSRTEAAAVPLCRPAKRAMDFGAPGGGAARPPVDVGAPQGPAEVAPRQAAGCGAATTPPPGAEAPALVPWWADGQHGEALRYVLAVARWAAECLLMVAGTADRVAGSTGVVGTPLRSEGCVSCLVLPSAASRRGGRVGGLTADPSGTEPPIQIASAARRPERVGAMFESGPSEHFLGGWPLAPSVPARCSGGPQHRRSIVLRFVFALV